MDRLERDKRVLSCNRYENSKPLPQEFSRDFEKCKVWSFTEDGRSNDLSPKVSYDTNSNELEVELPITQKGGWSGVTIDVGEVRNGETANYLVFKMKSSCDVKADEMEVKFGCPNDNGYILKDHNNTDGYTTVAIPLSAYFTDGKKPQGAGRLVFAVNDWHMRDIKNTDMDVATQYINIKDVRLAEKLPELEESLKGFKNS